MFQRRGGKYKDARQMAAECMVIRKRRNDIHCCVTGERCSAGQLGEIVNEDASGRILNQYPCDWFRSNDNTG